MVTGPGGPRGMVLPEVGLQGGSKGGTSVSVRDTCGPVAPEVSGYNPGAAAAPHQFQPQLSIVTTNLCDSTSPRLISSSWSLTVVSFLYVRVKSMINIDCPIEESK